jgi:hypothetical protein
VLDVLCRSDEDPIDVRLAEKVSTQLENRNTMVRLVRDSFGTVVIGEREYPTLLCSDFQTSNVYKIRLIFVSLKSAFNAIVEEDKKIK